MQVISRITIKGGGRYDKVINILYFILLFMQIDVEDAMSKTDEEARDIIHEEISPFDWKESDLKSY